VSTLIYSMGDLLQFFALSEEDAKKYQIIIKEKKQKKTT